MNLYQPHLMRVTERIVETPDTTTLRLEFQDSAVAQSFRFQVGQFAEYSVFGEGECTFCIASAPTRPRMCGAASAPSCSAQRSAGSSAASADTRP